MVDVPQPRKRRSLIGRKRRVRRKPAVAESVEPDETLEALEWDGVDWTGEVDEEGVEIGLVADDWDIPADLEVLENTMDPDCHFESHDRDDAGVWDDEVPSSAGLSEADWDDPEPRNEGSFDAFKKLVESEKGAPKRGSSPRASNNYWKLAIAAAGAILLIGLGALGLFSVAGIGALVVTSDSQDEAMVIIEEPTIVPLVPVKVQGLEEEELVEEPKEEAMEERDVPHPAAPAHVEEEPTPELEPEPIAEAPPPEPAPPVVAEPETGKKKKKKRRKKKDR